MADIPGGLEVLEGIIPATFDEGGGVLTTGAKNVNLGPMGYGGTITSATLLADQSGSIVIDVWKCTFSEFDAGATHPVDADSITASAPPTLSAAAKSQDTTLTGWTTTFSAGDVFEFNIDSVSTITKCTLTLAFTKTP